MAHKHTLEEMQDHAMALFTICGSYISQNSPVGIASTDETVGLANRLLVAAAYKYIEQTKQNREDNGNGES